MPALAMTGNLFHGEDVLSAFMDYTYGGNDPVVKDEDFSFFITEPESEIPSLTTPFEFEDLHACRVVPKNIINRKRKSEDWDSKPLEKRPVQAKPEVNNEFIAFARECSMDTGLTECADLFVNMLVSDSGKNKMIDWSAVDSGCSMQAKQKRTRWVSSEIRSLWAGIEKHGNNWREIKKGCLTDRTYYQVKDKGRRLLTGEGWISGRSKSDTDEASEDAKVIGARVNKRYAKLQKRR